MSIFKVIDVSEHQGIIDWEKVKAAGIYGAIIRCGYGQDIINQDDKYWKQNVSECERLGIPYGVYLYSYASDATAAKGEANHVLRLMKDCKKVSFPVYIDIEEEKNKAHAVEIGNTFCEIMEKAGYWTGVYANEYFFTTCLKDFWKYTKWCAKYSKNKPNVDGVEMWQYTSGGAVPGISGRVDMNECYRDFPKDIAGSGSTKPSKPGLNGKEALVAQAQTHINNTVYANGGKIRVNGTKDEDTVKGLVKLFQHCYNLDKISNLDVDSIIGSDTRRAIGATEIKKGYVGYLASFLEIALMAHGYDPKGVEWPGEVGSGCYAALVQFQKDKGYYGGQVAIAGKTTITDLLS